MRFEKLDGAGKATQIADICQIRIYGVRYTARVYGEGLSRLIDSLFYPKLTAMRFHHTTCSAARRSSCEGASSTFLMFLYGAWNAFHSHLQKDRPLNFSVQHATMFPGSRHYDVNWNIFVTTWLSDIKRQLCRKISVGFSLPVQVYNDCFHRMWNASSDLFSLVLKCQNHIAGYRHTWHCARLFWIVKSVVVCVHAFEESTEGCYKTDPVLRFFGKVAFANFRKSRMRLFFCVTLHQNNSPANWTRDLFKPSKDTENLLFSVCKDGKFWISGFRLPQEWWSLRNFDRGHRPWVPTPTANLWFVDLFNTWRNSASLELLIEYNRFNTRRQTFPSTEK